MASSKNNFILRLAYAISCSLSIYVRKIHRAIGYKIYRYIKEPVSTRQAPKPDLNNPLSEIVKRLLGLHYFM
jgi:hypothetical protein